MIHTKEEILDDLTFVKDGLLTIQLAIQAMQQYSDQQNKSLMDENKELKERVEKLEGINKELEEEIRASYETFKNVTEGYGEQLRDAKDYIRELGSQM